MTGWATLFWIIVTFALLYPLNRWITSHVQGVAFLMTNSRQAATWFFWVLFLPGTFLHEVSHWLTAMLLGVKTSRFSLWPKYVRKGQLQMGAVQVEGAGPIRHSLIGVAPLIFGSIVVFLLGQWLDLGRIAESFSTGNPETMWRSARSLLSIPDVWIWFYLIFAIANAMLPSASDRESWWSTVLYLCLALFIVIAFDLNPTVSPAVQSFGSNLLTLLLSAFLITIGVDLIFVVLITIIEGTLSFVLGRRINYNR